MYLMELRAEIYSFDLSFLTFYYNTNNVDLTQQILHRSGAQPCKIGLSASSFEPVSDVPRVPKFLFSF